MRGYFDAGLNVTLCTDGWLMAGVSLSDEYWLAHTELGFSRQEIDQLIVNGFAAAFLPWPERLELSEPGTGRAGRSSADGDEHGANQRSGFSSRW